MQSLHLSKKILKKLIFKKLSYLQNDSCINNSFNKNFFCFVIFLYWKSKSCTIN